nr:pyridoxal-dependent decarboxylase [Nocardia wallacei]
MVDLPEGWTDSAPFPATALDDREIQSYLDDRLAEIPSWHAGPDVVRFGVPMPAPDPLALAAMHRFTARNSNNVGIHTRFGDGAAGTRRVEKEALSLLGGLFHGGALDGYVTSGASEGALQAVRIGRSVLRAAGTAPVLITSELAHPSVFKAADLADLRVERLSAAGPSRTTDPEELADLLENLAAEGITGYLVISTVGYFGTGGVDDVSALCRVLDRHRDRHPGTAYYHHLDAAFGGLILPFTDPANAWDFRNRGVHSLAVDPHKSALVPYSCGVFLCRKGLLEHIAYVAEQSGVVDETVSGSRPGAAAAALWAALMAHGFEGFRSIYTSCVELRDRLRARIAEIDPQAEFVAHPRMPVLAVSFGGDGTRLPATLEDRYRLHAARLPGVPARDFYHLYVVADHRPEHVERLVQDLDAALPTAAGSRPRSAERLVTTVAAAGRATACPRHVLVHPPGQRDPSRYPSGYSFHTFVPRKQTAEPFRSIELTRSTLCDSPLVLYAPDLDRPFENELGGIALDGRFHFEVLDSYQQQLSLIGAAHLILHSDGDSGRAVANFHADGSFRSLELRTGNAGSADEVQIFENRVIVKMGKSSKSVYRGSNEYSFSVDTAAEIRVDLRPGAAAAKVVHAQYNYDPRLPRRRHMRRELYRRFPNRFFGEILAFEVGVAGALDWAAHPWPRRHGVEAGLLQESAVAGSSRTRVDIADRTLTLRVAACHGDASYRLRLPLDTGHRLASSLPRLDVSHPSALEPTIVAAHGEALYAALDPVVNSLRVTALTEAIS